MRNWRIITAAAAVVLAMLAAVLAYQYLNQADERAADKVEQVETFVVAKPIPKGTMGATAVSEKLIESRAVTKKDVPPSAITSDDQIADLVAVADLAEGQIIVAEMFQTASAVSGFSGELSEGKVAVSISVDSQHGVAGLIVPGDSVNVMVSMPVQELKSPADAAGNGEPITAHLLSGLKVLAVGSTTLTSAPAEGEENTQSLGLLTLEVDPRQAQQLAHASSPLIGGSFTLALNTPGFDAEAFEIPVEIIETWNLFDQPLTELKAKQDAVGNSPGANTVASGG